MLRAVIFGLLIGGAGAGSTLATRGPSATAAGRVELGLPASPRERIDQAVSLLGSAEHLFEAYRLVHSIHAEDLEAEPYAVRLRYGWALARAAYELGRHDETRQAADYLLDLAGETGDPAAEMYGRYYRASGSLSDPDRLDPEPQSLTDLRTVAERAQASGGDALEFLARLALGKLQTGEPARQELDRALAIAEKLANPTYVFRARCEIARQVARRDPRAADDLLRRAIEDYPPDGDPWAQYGWQGRLDVIWAARPRAEAVDQSLRLLDQIEEHMTRQGWEATGRMGFFSSWVAAYRRVVGFLLRVEGTPDRSDVELAFELAERMRGRVLLDQLATSGAAGLACRSPEARKRGAELRAAITALQRDVRTASLRDAARIRREIEVLMLTEEGLERALECPEGTAGPRAFAGLAEVERTLGADEALLEYQTGGWTDPFGSFDGGSWVFVVTSEGTWVLPLPDRNAIRIQRDAFLGAVPSRDGSEAAAAAALHESLLREALGTLPRRIAHLIVVPHGPVDGLPLAALRESAAGAPLAGRYRFSYAPSATLWLRWRGDRKPTGAGAVAFVDPSLESGWERLWPRRGSLDLRPLSGAREEGRVLVESLGEPSIRFEGDAASEEEVKRADLRSAGFLLFAAHAVVDERFPRRSAIVLAPGSRAEDGLLQPPEVADLPLGGAIVALSACQSATGRAVEGEGLVSLARSFLQAGAVAVVGDLWPARDDEAASLFGSIYLHLGAGRTLDEAVRRAQREAWEAGVPAEGWAGVVAIGAADLRLRPERDAGAGRSIARLWWALLPVPVVLWILRRRRASPA